MELDTFARIANDGDMIETLLFRNENFSWIDFENPQQSDLDTIGKRFGLHKTSIQDCLDPEHLPKHEIIEKIQFIILRAPEETPPKKGVSIQDLSRKIAIFIGPDFLITIHRAPLACIKDALLLKPIQNHSDHINLEILSSIVHAVLYQYERTIDSFFSHLDELEASVFSVPGSRAFKLKTAYYFKRRTFVFKLILKLTRDAVTRITQTSPNSAPLVQDLKENCDSLFFYVDELYENVNTLINLHVSLVTQKTTEASHRTGEIVRILTLISIFLLPLNVITGIYGMNFEHMPELKSELGYPLALLGMLVVVGVSYLWMRRKGWLKPHML